MSEDVRRYKILSYGTEVQTNQPKPACKHKVQTNQRTCLQTPGANLTNERVCCAEPRVFVRVSAPSSKHPSTRTSVISKHCAHLRCVATPAPHPASHRWRHACASDVCVTVMEEALQPCGRNGRVVNLHTRITHVNKSLNLKEGTKPACPGSVPTPRAKQLGRRRPRPQAALEDT